MTNGGSIRNSFVAGNITRLDVNSVLPFNNNVEIRRIPGSSIRRYLEEEIPMGYANYNASDLSDCTYSGYFLQTAGLKYALNPVSDTIISVEVLVDGHWYPLEDDQLYTVANNDYAFRDFGVSENDLVYTSPNNWKDDLIEFLDGLDNLELDQTLYERPNGNIKLYNREKLQELGCSNVVGEPFSSSDLPLRSQECLILIKNVDGYVEPPFSFDV